MNAIEVKKDIYWVGALDPDLRIFDIIMYTPYGTSYNSYAVKGSHKTAVFETVKEKFFDQYLERLKSINIDPENIDYIVVDHTEPDHAGSVAKLLELSKNARVVGSAAAIKFLSGIVNRSFNSIIVNDGDTLSLGNKTLKFISAPFLHWPDSMYTFIPEEKLLITCDSFGSHYCNPLIFNDLNQNDSEYMDALKYYFDCIMGPFKPYVLKAAEKIKTLDIDTICPGHGPILRQDPFKIVRLYEKWSSEEPSTDRENKVVICYVSAYGFTESLANKIVEGINASGNFAIETYNVIEHNINDILEKIHKADGVLFGSPTINGDALKPIYELLIAMNPLIDGKKVAAAFGSYGWSGEAVPNIESRLKELRMNVLPGLKVNFKPSEKELTSAFNFGESFAQKIQENINKAPKAPKKSSVKKWRCIVCGVIMEGIEPPEACPACGAGKDQFVEVETQEIYNENDTEEHFAIIGNGAAGYYAAKTIREINRTCKITIISVEKYLSYYRPLLSTYLSANIPDSEFFISPEDWYKDNNIDLMLNTEIKKIDIEDKKLLLSSESTVQYDKLIIANGSSCFMPPVKGNELNGVFTLKDKLDAEAIKSFASHSKNAVVIGGGLLGLEAAWELKNSGLNVTVVEFANRLLPRQLDEKSAILLKNAVTASNINLLLGKETEEILGSEIGKVRGVRLKSGEVIDSDIVLFSVGIRSNKALASASGISVNNGIIVNDKMGTNIRDIYACGDAAEFNGRVYGNWPAATEMGKIAGANAAGEVEIFSDFIPSNSFNAMNIEIFSCGDVTAAGEKISVFEEALDNGTKLKKLFFREGRLIGGILIGDTKKSVKLLNAVTAKKSIQESIKDII